MRKGLKIFYIVLMFILFVFLGGIYEGLLLIALIIYLEYLFPVKAKKIEKFKNY